MAVYFTSDTHFGHTNIIEYAKRPFSSVDEMNEGLVERWNSVVSKDDTVYHLGDVSFMSPNNTLPFLERLNGKIHLIVGNHDSKKMLNLSRWSSVHDLLEISLDGYKIVLCHYPMAAWNGSGKGSLMLFGHMHNSMLGNTQSLDVGVDCWNCTPTTLPNILNRMSNMPEYHLKKGGNYLIDNSVYDVQSTTSN